MTQMSRIALGCAGLTATLLAFAMPTVVTPHVIETVRLLGNDYLLVGVIGLCALGIGLVAFASGRSSTFRRAVMPQPEKPVVAARPGADVDAMLGTVWIDLPILYAKERRAIRHRVRDATVEMIVRTDGCDRPEAERRIAEGTWTDDRVAAAFIRPDASRRVWVAPLRGQIRFSQLAKRAIEAMERRAPAHGGLAYDGDGRARNATASQDVAAVSLPQ